MARTYLLQNQVINWQVKKAGGFNADVWTAEYYACLNDYGFVGYEGMDVTLTVNNDFSMWGSKTTQSNGTEYSFKNIRPSDMGPYLDYDLKIGTYYGETAGDFIFLTIYGENTDQSVSSTTVNKILNYPIQIYYGEDDGSGGSSSTPILSSNNTISLRYFEYTGDQRIGVDVFVNNGTNIFNTGYGSIDSDTLVTVYLFRSSSTEDLEHLDFEYPTNNQAYVTSHTLTAAGSWGDVEFNLPKTDNSYYYFARACWRDAYDNTNYYCNSQYLYIRSSSSYEPPEIYLSASINNSGIVTTSFSYDYEDTLDVTSYVYTLEDCTNGEERVERRTLTTPTCNFLSKMIPGRKYYVSVVVNYSYFDFATSTTKNSSAETYTGTLEYKKYNKSLKAIFTDIADAAEYALENSGTYLSGKRTLPNIVESLNNLDTSYKIELEPNYDDNYDDCIKSLANIIRARTSTSGNMTIQDMAAKIRQISSDSEREYYLGSRVNAYNHAHYSANYDYGYMANYASAGEVVYVEIPATNSKEMAVITKNSYRVKNDYGEYEFYYQTVVSTSILTLTIDSRHPNNPSISNSSVNFAIYKDLTASWTNINPELLDFYTTAPDGHSGTIYATLGFYKYDNLCRFPTSINLLVDYYHYEIEGSTTSMRLQGTPSVTGEYGSDTASITKTAADSSYGDVAAISINGTITGVWNGVTKTITVNYDFDR